MITQSGGAGEAAAAYRTTVRFNGGVDGEMIAEVVLVCKCLATNVTGKGLVLHVRFPEYRQCYTAH